MSFRIKKGIMCACFAACAIMVIITLKPLHYRTTDIYIRSITDQKTQQLQQNGDDNKPLNFLSSGNNFPLDCKTFDFIPSEWTLKWKKTFEFTLENETCLQLLSSIFESEQVKAVIYPNKTIEYFGCTEHTQWCVPGAHFDAKLNIRINTPPCCIQKMFFMLEILTKGFQRLGIPHMLFGGAVVGWLRNRKIIPYDDDMDLIVNGSYWRSKAMMIFLYEIVKKHGFYIRWHWDTHAESFSIKYSNINANGVDVWAYRFLKDISSVHIDNGKLYIFNDATPDFDYNTLNPPKLVNFNGITTFIPNDPVKYADVQYGKGKWQKELMCKKIHTDRKCIDDKDW